jgi:hypothetical protein
MSHNQILGLGAVPDEVVYGTIVSAVSAVIEAVASSYDKTPYHDSATRGIDWVNELVAGHPEQIRHELGMHINIFNRLLRVLQKMGYSHFKHI